MAEPVWAPAVFSKNRERMPNGEIAAAFRDAVLNQDEVKRLLSRALLHRRHADPRPGFDKKFPPRGQRQRASRAWTERNPGLSLRNALE